MRDRRGVVFAGVVFILAAVFAFGCGVGGATSSSTASTPATVTQTAPSVSTTTTSSVMAPTASTHYKNATFGFEFDYPKAWKFSEEPEAGTEEGVFLVASAGEDSQTYNSTDWPWVAVAVLDRGMSGVFSGSESNDGAQIAMGMAESGDGLIFQQPTPQTVSGYPAARVAREDQGDAGKAMIQIQLYVVADAYMFTVVGAAPKDELERYKAVLESFLSSFTVIAPSRVPAVPGFETPLTAEEKTYLQAVSDLASEVTAFYESGGQDGATLAAIKERSESWDKAYGVEDPQTERLGNIHWLAFNGNGALKDYLDHGTGLNTGTSSLREAAEFMLGAGEEARKVDPATFEWVAERKPIEPADSDSQ